MKVLVTGASGYIGTHLVKALASHGAYQVIATSRSSMRSCPDNVQHLRLDLLQPGWTHSLPETIDVVIHLAQSKRYRRFPEGAEDVIAVNVNSTLDLADWAYRHGVNRFLFASTGNVYPTSMRQPVQEEDPPRPDSLYGASKLSAEILLEQYGALFEIVLMRIFGVYGPGQRDMLIPSIVRRVLNAEEITLSGGAGVFISPLFVSDCIQMIESLISVPLPKRVQRVNLAGPEMVSLAQIVTILEDLLTRSARTVTIDGEPLYLVGACDQAKKLTGHESFVTLVEGLRHTVKGMEDG